MVNQWIMENLLLLEITGLVLVVLILGIVLWRFNARRVFSRRLLEAFSDPVKVTELRNRYGKSVV